MRLVLLFALVALAPAAQAATATCYTDDATNQHLCYQPSKVKVNGTVRAAPLIMGGPKGIRETSFTIVTDCAKGITTLQDRQGVNFAGGWSDDTAANSALAKWICEEPKPRQDKKLRQFSK
jgi:hypothetical protein